MTRRPKPSRSGRPGCAPTATPWRMARATVRSIVTGSPPWHPQAMFAEVTSGMISSSLPSDQLPKLSPRSQLMSKVRWVMRVPCPLLPSVGGVKLGDDIAGAHNALVFDRERAHAATDLRVHLVELLHDLDEADDAAALDDVALGDERRRAGVGTAVEDAGDRRSDDVLVGHGVLLSAEMVTCAFERFARLAACRERVVEGHPGEADVLVGLGLADAIEVRADDRRDRGVPTAGDGVGEQRDRLNATRHLDGADRVAEVDDVRGVVACARRGLPVDEGEWLAAEAVADAVGVGRDRPARREEHLEALRDQPVAGEPHHDAQLDVAVDRRAQVLGQLRVGRALDAAADRYHVARPQRAALEATQ